MKTNLRNLPIQWKMSGIFIIADIIVFAVTMLLLSGINTMSGEMDMVYEDNMHLNELSDALTAVQDSMTDYLNAKTTDSLEEFYRNEQAYSDMVDDLNDEIGGTTFLRMERSIRHMSEEYLDIVSQTIEAKRGRNVEKYRVRYENATQIYGYINTYINSLNSERFRNNSENYSRLSGVFKQFETISILVLFVIIIGNVALIMRLTRSILSPLKDLAGSADEVAKGNFDIALPEVRSEDEIGIATGAFNQMVVSLRQYIERLRQSMEIQQSMKEKELLMEAHLKDAQLKYLQAQINPHFLFNTLNAGAQLAMMESADRTYEYVQNVAEFFRYNVKKGNETVTLRDEIELVDNYIYILNVRFSGEIHYEKEIDESLLGTQMPGMILQPIVENCVNHGIREMAGEGQIKISVYREEDMVCVSVKDNGTGISKATIEQILNGTYREEEHAAGSNGIGMDNVIARLRLYRESDDVMTIVSEGRGRGTEVMIYLDYKSR